MDKLLEYLALAGAGIAIYFVAENNMPKIKQTISNIAPSISNMIPVSDVLPRAPIPQSRHCPKGMYADYTDGILTCRDAHGTRELDPHVKRLIPQQQWAYGDYYAGNMTQPLVQPDINKQIESQIKKKHQKEVKHQDISSTTKRLIKERATDIYTTQVECPHDVSKLNCGTHCMKNGHVMVVDCSGVEHTHGDKKPTKRKPPAITVPPNFPGAVIVQPYPEDISGTSPQDTTGQTNPDWNLPTQQQEPDYQPEIGPVTPEPPKQPQIGQPTPEPPHQPQIGAPTPISPSGGKTIYKALRHYTNFTGSETGGGQSIGPEGINQEITYKSNHKHVTSHRVNIAHVPDQNLEATVYLTWPAIEAKGKDTHCVGSTGEGHAELALKFWGPRHHDSKDCCYCYASAVPSLDGKSLKLGFGGEGNHPDTDTIHHESPTKTIPLRPNQYMGIKGMIWKNGSMVHQEIWYDANGNGQWVKATQWDHPNCGAKGHYDTKPATVDGGAMFEFRIDCSNIRFANTDLAVIQPSSGFSYSGPEGYITEDEHLFF